MVETDESSDNLVQRALTLDWDASYEIVLALMHLHPQLDVNTVGLQQLKDLIIALPNFVDDPALAHDALLSEILREWYEEATQ